MSTYTRLILQQSRLLRLFSYELTAAHVRPVANQPQLCCSRQSCLWTNARRRKLRENITPVSSAQPVRGAKGKASVDVSKKKAAQTETPIEPPTPSDPTICSGVNILKDGADPPLKPDSEYPDWLWGLLEMVQKPSSYTELPPTSKQYWRRYNKQKAHERNTLQKQLGRS